MFNVSATILSYLGYLDEIEKLLPLLDHNSRRYLKGHFSILTEFLPIWPPVIEKLIEFGDT